MFWPVVVASMLLVGFSQMFYTLAQIDCADAWRDMGYCNMRESYKLVYHLLLGEPVVDLGDETEVASAMVVLMVLFTALFALLGFTAISLAILVGSKVDFEQVALKSFWEPKLTFVLFICGPASGAAKSISKLEIAWTVLTNILYGRDGVKGTYWYACFVRKSAFVKGFYWVAAAIIVPLWLLVGLVSFGLLWPPQVRRRLFRPSVGATIKLNGSKLTPTELYALQVSSMRDELGQIRDMSYERSHDVQREVRELKEILRLVAVE